jgi:hypothetical protein
MRWDPRDLDTWMQFDADDRRAQAEAESAQRIEAERRAVVARMRGGR